MGYARHIGRVGALAVTLGVGVAIATTPGFAYAEPSNPSTSTSDTSTSDTTSTDATGQTDTTADTAPSPDPDPESVEEPTEDVTEEVAEEDAAAEPVEEGAEEELPATGESDEDAPPAESAQDDGSAADSVADETRDESAVGTEESSAPEESFATDTADDVVADEQPSESEPQPETFSLAAATADNGADTATAATTFTTTALTTPPAPQPRPTLVSVITDFVASVLRPLLNPGEGSPIQIPILTAMLSLVRDEFERILLPRNTKVASQQTTAQLVDPTDQHVLVIGVDGTNLSRILADDYNQNFFNLMNTSTTAASSIVGHTTISNPSWTAILTGVWGERTGVINNVFTPWTYNRFPTVFNQLEALNPDIDTMAVGNWNVINAIAGAGSIPADENIFIPQIAGDTDWLLTDDAVADATVDAIDDADAPNFLFSYFVGVDENGHLYGGASPQYAEAIRNMDDNLGEIMAAVAAREAATGEDWTIIVVTDHGHQPQKGFGHGFQTPSETATFVIADGPDFQDGHINQAYEIVDTTPTVVSLFGGTPRPNSDGVPLTTLGPGIDPVDLHDALEEAIAQNRSPDILTDVRLGLRTIFATVPYYIYEFGNDFAGSVPSFLVVPVNLLFDGLYVATNVPAQIVALLTGVSGASIFPLLPPPPPSFPSEEANSPTNVILVCSGATAGAVCGEPSVA